MTYKHLEKLNISESGKLALKPGAKLHAAETDSIGKDELWSADGLYRHLCILKDLIPRMVSMFDAQ